MKTYCLTTENEEPRVIEIEETDGFHMTSELAGDDIPEWLLDLPDGCYDAVSHQEIRRERRD